MIDANQQGNSSTGQKEQPEVKAGAQGADKDMQHGQPGDKDAGNKNRPSSPK